MFWKRLLYYMNPMTLFRKEPEGETTNFSLKSMHGMNRISVLMFLLAIGVLIYRYFFR